MKRIRTTMRSHHTIFTIISLTIPALLLNLCCAMYTTRKNHPAPGLEFIRVSGDGTHFIHAQSGARFVAWGFNYDHDDTGRLIEDYWHKEWPTVVEDFREMKALGANVVRIHLQTAKLMSTATKTNKASFAQLARLVKLAEQKGLYLDITCGEINKC